MEFFDSLMEKANRRKYREHYEKAEEALIGLNVLPAFRIPYEILDMQPQEIYMNNEKAYDYLTNDMVMTKPEHKAMQEMGQFYFDKMSFLADCINASIAKKRIYDRLGLGRKFAESEDFLEKTAGLLNKYYDAMVSQYKICESGAYGEYKVNEKLKAYAKGHGGIILENIRLEVGADRESAETDTLYITAGGIYSIETKYFGAYNIKVDSQNNWYKDKGDGWQPMDKSPSRQSIFHVKNLVSFFDEKGTAFGRLPVIPVVVMANPKTVVRNGGNVGVYSIDHMNEMFRGVPPVIDTSTQLQIQKLITGSTLEGKAYRFYDYYGYLRSINGKMKEWFRYYDGIFRIILKILQLCDYTTYVYKDRWKIVKAEKQILGDSLYYEWINAYNQMLTFRKERIRYNENFGEQYHEMALQRK